MIVSFNNTLLDIISVTAGSDADTLSFIQSHLTAPFEAQIIVDDTDVLNNASNLSVFYAVMTGPTLTSVVRRNKISLTSSINPIDMSDVPVITIQLKYPDGITDLGQIETVTLAADFGVPADAQVTTNGSGYATTTYRGHKGASAVLRAAAPPFVSEALLITLNTPTTPSKQNWIDSNDLRNEAVSASKIDASVANKINPPQGRDAIVNAYLADEFNPNIKSSIRGSVVDEAGFMYVYGKRDATNYSLRKINRQSGVIIASYDFAAGEGFREFNGSVRMHYDGKHIVAAYKPSGGLYNHIARIRVSNMTLADDFDNSAQLVGCSHEITLFDGDKIWSYIEAYPGSTSLIDIGWVDPTDGTFTHSFEIPTILMQDTFGFNMVADNDTVYMPGYHYANGAVVLRWSKAGVMQGVIGLGLTTDTPLAVASDGTYLYAIIDESVSGPALIKFHKTEGLIDTMTFATIGGRPVDFVWQGGFIWAVVRVVSTYYLKKISTNPLSVDQTINLDDFTPTGIHVAPGSLIADDKNLYFSNSGTVEL